MKRFKDWKIATKIMSISLVTIVLVVVGMLFYFIPLVEQKLMEEKEKATRNVVDTVYSLVSSYESRVKEGKLKVEEAQRRANENIKRLRYNGNDYFGIMSLDVKIIMHPIKPELDGTDATNEKDTNGKYLFQEFARVARDKGEGFVDYYWPKPNETRPSPKLTYVKLFPQWGWVIYSGIYIDDVNSEISRLQTKLIAATFAIAFLIILIAYFVSRLITIPLTQAVNISKELAEGNLMMNVEVTSSDEVGQFLGGMRIMIDKLKNIVADVQSASVNVASGSQQMSRTAQQMSQGASEQAASAEQVTDLAPKKWTLG